MTIEIKQLIIRAVVEERREPAALDPGALPQRRAASQPIRRTASPDLAADREAVVAECARQVLRELRRGRGR
jgi:hypothetical protein